MKWTVHEITGTERVTDDEEAIRNMNAYYEEYESSDTELGEPSADCNCAELAEIREELTDIKAMIGRLLRNGGDAE